MSQDNLRKFIREEIGRNLHTIDNNPITYDDFQDYDIQIDGHPDGNYHLTIWHLEEKIYPTTVFRDLEEAENASRLVIDQDRVTRMNKEK